MTVPLVTGRAPHRIDRPVMRQQWRNLAYLHWPYDPVVVQALLPRGLEVDTHAGKAWVGLVPFQMVGIAPRRGPAIPYLGSFPETNVRTYVLGPEGPGVWFQSLDINRILPVLVARTTYRLPYAFSKMSIEIDGDTIAYTARRRWPEPRGAASLVRLGIGERIEKPDAFGHFLSARWRLYTMLGKHLTVARVDHEPWPLHRAELRALSDDLVAAAHYPAPTGEPHVLFSPGVSVRVDLPRRLG